VAESAARLQRSQGEVQKLRADAGALQRAAEGLREIKDRLLGQIAPLKERLAELQDSLQRATEQLTNTTTELTLKSAAHSAGATDDSRQVPCGTAQPSGV